MRDPDVPNTSFSRWFVFLAAAMLMVLLCLAGARCSLWELTLPPWPRVSGSSVGGTSAGWFMLVFALTWVGCLALLVLFPRGLSDRAGVFVLIALAVICRLAMLAQPASDDVNRYLWEGRLIAAGISPYAHAPDDPTLAALAAADPFHARINHPDLSAVYPPFAVLLFAMIGRIAYSAAAVKLFMILCDLGALWFLLLLLKHRNLDQRWSVLYAFNPVILYGFAGQGHFDAIHNLMALAAIFLYDRRRWAWMFLVAGLMAQSKYIGVLALPFLVRRDNWKWVFLALVTMGLPFAPFLAVDHRGTFAALTRFGGEYAFNGSIHAVLRAALGGIPSASRVVSAILPACLLFAWWRLHPERHSHSKDDPVNGFFFVFGSLLVLSPTVHFWYLSWVIPFLALRPAASWMVLCLTVAGYFTSLGVRYDTGELRIPVWAQIAEWLPFWLLLLREGYLAWLRARIPVDVEPGSVSVIIPARNEEANIAECVRVASGDACVKEVIVVDGGSTDDTRALAGKAGARVVTHAAAPEAGGGRGGQIRAGLATATGDVVAVLHADTRLAAPACSKILDLLRRQPSVIGGAVGGVFDGRGWLLRLLEYANDFRAACLGISFGDQVQFFRRRPVVERDVFPAYPLMEDVELSMRLSRLGRRVFLFGDAVMSSRKWRGGGVTRAWLIVRLVTGHLWKRALGASDPVAMYRRYYGSSRGGG